jgi:hypothetical protein
MRRILVSSVIFLLAQLGTAFAAGPFDGNWSGEVAGTTGPVRTCTASIKGQVQDNVLHGVITWGKFKPSDVGGKIAADGSFTSPAGRVTGKFEGNNFTGSFSVPNGSCNPYKITMSRS